jgi:pimeloyl-ACP methyl ester carboxylesterase
VFLAGAGAVGLDYLNVHQLVAGLTTSVLYDRAGNGWSDPVALPRTSNQVISELDELLRVADVPRPYVLVGHSLGGLYARHFATRFPDLVAGLVLLDPAHEDYDAYMPEQLKAMRNSNRTYQVMNAVLGAALSNPITSRLLTFVPALRRKQDQYRRLFEQEMAQGFPEGIRKLLIERHVSPEWLRVGLLEAKNVEQLYMAMRGQGLLPDVPLVVLCSIGTDGFKEAVLIGESEELLRGEVEGKRRLYEDLARSVPRGQIRFLDAGHVTMHLRHPDAVVRAITDVVSQARG